MQAVEIQWQAIMNRIATDLTTEEKTKTEAFCKDVEIFLLQRLELKGAEDKNGYVNSDQMALSIRSHLLFYKFLWMPEGNVIKAIFMQTHRCMYCIQLVLNCYN